MENLKKLIREYFELAKASAIAIRNGKEDLKRVLWWWGAPFYIFSYFVTDNFIKWNPIKAIDVVVSLINIAYFSWHIWAIKKCLPKTPELSKGELEEIKKQRIRKFFRKLFLKEPITEWKTENFFLVLDIFVISVYLLYIFA